MHVPLLTGRVLAMSNFWERQMTLETGLLVPPMSRTCVIRCAFLVGCKRILLFRLFSHPRLDTREMIDKKGLFQIHECTMSSQHFRWVSPHSFFLFVVTTSRTRCSFANMAWDHSASVGRMPTIWEFWLAASTALMFISHVSSQE